MDPQRSDRGIDRSMVLPEHAHGERPREAPEGRGRGCSKSEGAERRREADRTGYSEGGREGLPGAQGTLHSSSPLLCLLKTNSTPAQAAGKEKLHSAEAAATEAYNAAAAKVGDAEAAAKATYDDAKHKAQETQQSWGAWLGSWVGYGKSKVQEAESRTAADVAAAAAKVQQEAEKKQ